MNIRIVSRMTVKSVQAKPDEIFVFGDNLLKKGKAGQAQVRDEPNTFGVPTKRLPSTKAEAYFSDQEDEMQAVVDSLRELYRLSKNHTLVFPEQGIGTGLAKMPKSSPQVWAKMTSILNAHFGYDITQKADEPSPDQ